MKSNPTCPKCGSSRIIQNIQVIDRSDSGGQPLSLRRGTRMLGGILRLPRDFPLDAWTCGACGYTELYVRQPAELLAADQASSSPLTGVTGLPGQSGTPTADQTRSMIFIALAVSMVLALGLLAAVAFFVMR
jgi:hypothetical protein